MPPPIEASALTNARAQRSEGVLRLTQRHVLEPDPWVPFPMDLRGGREMPLRATPGSTIQMYRPGLRKNVVGASHARYLGRDPACILDVHLGWERSMPVPGAVPWPCSEHTGAKHDIYKRYLEIGRAHV